MTPSRETNSSTLTFLMISPYPVTVSGPGGCLPSLHRRTVGRESDKSSWNSSSRCCNQTQSQPEVYKHSCEPISPVIVLRTETWLARPFVPARQPHSLVPGLAAPVSCL